MQKIWRWVSPSTLLFALLISPFPWVEASCTKTDQNGVTTTSRSSISGIQAAIGATSTDEGGTIEPANASVWMIGYFIVVIAGIVLGYRWRSGKARCISMTLLALAAIVLLAVEMLFHFGMAELVNVAPPAVAPSPPPPGKSSFDIRYTGWLLLAYSLHMLALLAVIGDWIWLRHPLETESESESPEEPVRMVDCPAEM